MKLTVLALVCLFCAVVYADRRRVLDYQDQVYGHGQRNAMTHFPSSDGILGHRPVPRPRPWDRKAMLHSSSRFDPSRRDSWPSNRGLNNHGRLDSHPDIRPIPELYRDSMMTEGSRHAHQNPCMIPCPRINSPVCGSNGITYDNNCELAVAACRLRRVLYAVRSGEC